MKFLLYFIAKVIHSLIHDLLLMNRGSDRIATHQAINSPIINCINKSTLFVYTFAHIICSAVTGPSLPYWGLGPGALK